MTRDRTADIWGDSVRAAALPGDGYQKCPDLVKNFLVKLLEYAGISTECEVFNMFAREIAQTELARIERGRVRQAMVPDFKIAQIEPGGDREVPRLWQLKAISSCKTIFYFFKTFNSLFLPSFICVINNRCERLKKGFCGKLLYCKYQTMANIYIHYQRRQRHKHSRYSEEKIKLVVACRVGKLHQVFTYPTQPLQYIIE